MNPQQIVLALKQFIPLLKIGAALTKTKADDIAVAVLESVLNDEALVQKILDELKATNKLPPGA